jgi:hypothetical protein
MTGIQPYRDGAGQRLGSATPGLEQSVAGAVGVCTGVVTGQVSVGKSTPPPKAEAEPEVKINATKAAEPKYRITSSNI